MMQSPINVSVCPHVKFLCFEIFFLKFFVAETKKKNSDQFEIFLFVCFSNKNLMLQVRKHAKTHTLSRFCETFFFFYPTKFTDSSKQTKTFYPKYFTTRWRIVKTCRRSNSCLMKKKQLLSTFINRIKHSDFQK